MSLESDLEAKGWRKDAAGVWSHPTRRRVAGDCNEAQSPVVERSVCDALARTAQTETRGSGKFAVRIVSFRCVLLDEDNLAGKFHVDALRYAAILPGDSPGHTTIQVTQVKVATEEEEHTRIVITPL